jgi:hypothetical protein
MCVILPLQARSRLKIPDRRLRLDVELVVQLVSDVLQQEDEVALDHLCDCLKVGMGPNLFSPPPRPMSALPPMP